MKKFGWFPLGAASLLVVQAFGVCGVIMGKHLYPPGNARFYLCCPPAHPPPLWFPAADRPPADFRLFLVIPVLSFSRTITTSTGLRLLALWMICCFGFAVRPFAPRCRAAPVLRPPVPPSHDAHK